MNTSQINRPNNINIYPQGTKVTTVIGSINGLITAATIRGTFVVYEVAYFNEGEIRTMWITEAEFNTEATKTKIGFKNE